LELSEREAACDALTDGKCEQQQHDRCGSNHCDTIEQWSRLVEGGCLVTVKGHKQKEVDKEEKHRNGGGDGDSRGRLRMRRRV
jgi:hypothetical protein